MFTAGSMMTMDADESAFGIWEGTVSESIRKDALWRMTVYRLSLFLVDMGWEDVSILIKDRRAARIADQLYRALGSIGANIAEGYSRGSGRDRARFYEYALGSARESRTWYFTARHVLGEEVIEDRINRLSQIIKMLLTIIPKQRKAGVFEEPQPYQSYPTLPDQQGE